MSYREQNKAFRKQLISEAAFQLLSDKPFELVSVDEIAAQLGCGKGTIYRYFENKDHLLNELVASGLRTLCQDMEERCVQNDDTIQALTNYITLQYHYFRKYNTILSSWSRRKLEQAIRLEWVAEIQTLLDSKVQMLVAILDRGLENKIIAPVDSLELARLLENIVRDATFPFVEAQPRPRDPNRVLDLMTSIFMNGIKNKVEDATEHEGGSPIDKKH
ncbi:MAG TPA: TetR/AcrR family transcriptional regulator [Syntrophomonadaceae bacterium]|nr:TetR/AcrR family transcriptional regulator [Syntrophomonadaceae bacterium]